MNTHEPTEEFLQSQLAGECRGLAIAIWPDLEIPDPFHNVPNALSGRLLHEALVLTLRAQGVRITDPCGDESIVDQPTAAFLFPSLTLWFVDPFPVAFRATVAFLAKTSLLPFASVGYYDRAEVFWRSMAPAAPLFDLHWFVEHHAEIMRPILARQIDQKAVFDQWMAARKAQASQDHK